MVEPLAKVLRCTVNCTVESGEHGVHGEHGELSSRIVSEAIVVSCNDFNRLRKCEPLVS